MASLAWSLCWVDTLRLCVCGMWRLCSKPLSSLLRAASPFFSPVLTLSVSHSYTRAHAVYICFVAQMFSLLFSHSLKSQTPEHMYMLFNTLTHTHTHTQSCSFLNVLPFPVCLFPSLQPTSSHSLTRTVALSHTHIHRHTQHAICFCRCFRGWM